MRCKSLIEAHYAATGSLHAASILNDWDARKVNIRHVTPFEAVQIEAGGRKRA